MSLLDRFRSSKSTPPPKGSPSGESPAPVDPRNRETIIITLRDLIERIPSEYLTPGPHDLDQVISFDIAALAERIACGQPTVSTAEVQRQLPGIFRDDVDVTASPEIRFPWRRLLALVRAAEHGAPEGGVSVAGAELLAQTLQRRKREEAPAPPPAHPRSSGVWRLGPLTPDPSRVDRTIEIRPPVPPAGRTAPLSDLQSAIQEMVDTKGQPTEHPFSPEGHRTLLAQYDQKIREIETLRRQLHDLQEAAEERIDGLIQERDELAAENSRMRTSARVS